MTTQHRPRNRLQSAHCAQTISGGYSNFMTIAFGGEGWGRAVAEASSPACLVFRLGGEDASATLDLQEVFPVKASSQIEAFHLTGFWHAAPLGNPFS